MHQLINKKKIYFYIFTLIFISTITNNKIANNIREYFVINKLEINVDIPIIEKKIYHKVNYLIDKNVFLIKKNVILNNLSELNFLQNISVKKNYPSTILIEANKTDFIGITFIDQKKYYIGKNGQFILTKEIEIDNSLPFIFGNFKITDYLDLISILNKYNINYIQIPKYYYHKNKRWDLYFNNNILLKLPNKNIEKAIKLFIEFKNKNKIKTGTVLDFRIENRIVTINE